MAKYKLMAGGCKDTETGACIPNAPGNRHWREFQAWLAAGNIPDPEFTEEELAEQAKADALTAVLAEYKAALLTPVTCVTSSGKTFIMDGQEDSATKMNDGITFTELVGGTRMDIVDFHNQVHTDVPLNECREIMLQQAQAYITAWKKKSEDRAALLNS